MNKIYIDLREENQWIKKYFESQDLVSVEELLSVIEDLDSENGILKEKIQDMETNIEENYKPISHYEEYGISENDFH